MFLFSRACLVTSGKATSWVTSSCSMVWWGELMVYLFHIFIDDSAKMYIFWWDMFFTNRINITFIWCINHFFYLNYFLFLFPQTFFTYFLWFLCLLSLESSVTFPISLFLILFWMLWMQFAVSKLKLKYMAVIDHSRRS